MRPFSIPETDAALRRMLVITLSNIGDVVLTFPVMDRLLDAFPGIPIDVVCGPKSVSFFDAHPRVGRCSVLKKNQRLLEKVRWINRLRRRRYDLVVDLRNTLIPLLLLPGHRTPLRLKRIPGAHMRTQHLERLRRAVDLPEKDVPRQMLHITNEKKARLDAFFERDLGGRPFTVITAGAADSKKCWPASHFGNIARKLREEKQQEIILLGNKEDMGAAETIRDLAGGPVLDMTGKTDLTQAAYVIGRSAMVLGNDSALLHLASYQDIPVVGVFGPTDPVKYGPWSSRSRTVAAPLTENERKPSVDKRSIPGLMERISPDEVWDAVLMVLTPGS